jgi:hypothetical protein
LCASPDGSIYFAARQSGLYRSDDGGVSWQPVSIHQGSDEQPSVTGVVMAQGPDNTAHLMVAVPGAVLISRDEGANWTAAGLGSPAPFVTALAVSPDYARDGIALAATIEDGVLRTDNYGEIWRPWGFGLFDLHVLGLAVSPSFVHDGTAYAVTESGVYRSRTSGRSWELTSFPAEAAPVLCAAISPDFAQDGRLYAGTEGAGLFTSDDRGVSWQRMAQLDSTGSINAILLAGQQPTGAEILVMTDGALWISQDGGESWSAWHGDTDFGAGLTAALAPAGFAAHNLSLLGLADGRILTLS